MGRGACLCGAVPHEADSPAPFFAHCHWRWCPHLAAGCLDGLAPTAHVFVHLGDDLPQRTEQSPGLAAYRRDPGPPGGA